MEAVLPFLLIAQGVMGGVDTVLNHEVLARLTGLVRRDHGLASWAISAFAVAAAFWSTRDFFAWRRLR